MSPSPRPDPVTTASRWHDRAVSARERGQPVRAEPWCRWALRLLEEAVGPRHPDVASVLNTLGAILKDQALHAGVVAKQRPHAARRLHKVPHLQRYPRGRISRHVCLDPFSARTG
jgi:hypothetical protein